MDKALALESSGPGSNPCEGGILFTEEAWKKWARFVIYKKVNKENGGNHYQTDFSTLYKPDNLKSAPFVVSLSLNESQWLLYFHEFTVIDNGCFKQYTNTK